MGRLSDPLRAALGYWWNLVSDAARMGFTATETIQLANQVAKDLGGSINRETNTAIAQLYGYARREVNAGVALQNANPSQGITGDMISTPPYARDIQEQSAYPVYNVKFEYTYIDAAGNTQVTYKTSVFSNGLPSTVGELQSAILDDAEALAHKYGHTLLSAILAEILAV